MSSSFERRRLRTVSSSEGPFKALNLEGSLIICLFFWSSLLFSFRWPMGMAHEPTPFFPVLTDFSSCFAPQRSEEEAVKEGCVSIEPALLCRCPSSTRIGTFQQRQCKNNPLPPNHHCQESNKPSFRWIHSPRHRLRLRRHWSPVEVLQQL